MLKINSTITLLFIIFGSMQLQAQSRRIQNDGSGTGLDRSIGASHRYNTPRKAEPVDYVKLTVDNLTEKLTLDGFQNAILRKIVMDYNETALVITEEIIPNEAKIEKINIEKAKMDVKITEILNEKQKVAFIELKKSNREKNKNKKNKKSKKNKESESETENELF